MLPYIKLYRGVFMRRSFVFWQFIGFFIVSLGGVLLHFLYELSGNNILFAPFSGVNESTAEHIKLLYFPLLILAFLERRFIKAEGFWCIKLLGTIFGLCLIPVVFYTANGVFGKTPDWFNITIFFISAAAALFFEVKLYKASIPCRRPLAAFILLILIGVLIIVFTFSPPKIGLFLDPVTGQYGI